MMNYRKMKKEVKRSYNVGPVLNYNILNCDTGILKNTSKSMRDKIIALGKYLRREDSVVLQHNKDHSSCILIGENFKGEFFIYPKKSDLYGKYWGDGIMGICGRPDESGLAYAFAFDRDTGVLAQGSVDTREPLYKRFDNLAALVCEEIVRMYK